MCTGVFYYTLGNLNAFLRSSLNSIQLLAVVKTRYIEEYGIDAILYPFVEDLKHLERVQTHNTLYIPYLLNLWPIFKY